MTVRAPQKGKAAKYLIIIWSDDKDNELVPGQGEHATEGEEKRKFPWVEKKHRQKRYRQPETYCTWGEMKIFCGGRLNVSHHYQELGLTWSQWFSAFWTGSGGSPPSCGPASSSPPSCCWPSRSRWTRPGRAPRHPPPTRTVSWWSSGSAATSRTTSRWGTRGRWWSHCCSCWDNYSDPGSSSPFSSL